MEVKIDTHAKTVWHTTAIPAGRKRILFKDYNIGVLWGKPKMEVVLISPENAVLHIVKITRKRAVVELLSSGRPQAISGEIKWRLV